MLPRVSFDFIVKRDIEFFVWSVVENDDIHLTCRGDHRSSEVISVTAAHPSIAQKRDLREPSLVREGGPLAVDE